MGKRFRPYYNLLLRIAGNVLLTACMRMLTELNLLYDVIRVKFVYRVAQRYIDILFSIDCNFRKSVFNCVASFQAELKFIILFSVYDYL